MNDFAMYRKVEVTSSILVTNNIQTGDFLGNSDLLALMILADFYLRLALSVFQCIKRF